MKNIIISLLVIIMIVTFLFRKKIFRLISVEIVMILFGFLIGPRVLNLLGKNESIGIEPVITLLIGITALFAGLKFRIRNIGIVKKNIFPTLVIYVISFSVSFLLFLLANNYFLHLTSLWYIVLISLFSASIFPSYYLFSKRSVIKSQNYAIVSNLTLFFVFFLLLFLTPLFENGSPFLLSPVYSFLFSLIDIILFSSIMLFLIGNSHDKDEFTIILSGIAIFNVAICYIFGINSASAMFFIGFILANSIKNDFLRFKEIIGSMEHPLFITLLLITGSFLEFGHSVTMSLFYFFIHIISLGTVLILFKNYMGKFRYGFIPQTGALYTILLSLLILNNSTVTIISSSIILANIIFYLIYNITVGLKA